jgi:hypothetical protein
MAEAWRQLKPEGVSRWINFDATGSGWRYARGRPPTMPSLQTEGVAYLWNLLSKRRVALLADEVGMGKTLQALGVAALLWRRKPDAKILVMAPNRDICLHWKREFTAFTRDHYREADDVVKADDGQPVPAVEPHFRLPDLASAVEKGVGEGTPGQLYLTTIHALSGLVDGVEGEEKTACAKRAGRALNRRIRRVLGENGFDLIIVDEAHYFRNRGGGSQRVAAATTFFGDEESRIAERALLLTATPSHTHLDDVGNILSYFLGADERVPNDPSALMQRYALRRLRRMGGQAGYTKHNYRREIATPYDFGDNPRDEMFFAHYQRRLVREVGASHEKRRFLYGYLEGFESAGHKENMSGAPDGCVDPLLETEGAKDFRAAADTQLLHRMSLDFRKLNGCAPDHPKYGGLVSQCVPPALFPMAAGRPLHEEKHLVFVRRIPSVREITNRINEQYDELMANHLRAVWGWDSEAVTRWRRSSWSREVFNEITKSVDGPAAEGDDAAGGEVEGAEQDEKDFYLRSRISDLFVTKKAADDKGVPPTTDCSRFSLSLRKSTSIFAMFMEPAADYLAAPYGWHYQYMQGDKQRLDYTKAAQVQRMKSSGLLPMEGLDVLAPPGASEQKYRYPVVTLWSLVFRHLTEQQRSTLSRWAAERPAVAENFANYIKAGFLFASPVMVELYGWHVRVRQGQGGEQHANVQRRYREFVAYARRRIAGSLLLRYFAAALDSFEQLCGKIIDHDADNWSKGWRTLTTLSNPAWFASGDSSHRQHLILGFNSPFYPNTLVATSVFQEGVNLHLQCRKVHHYGIAWTPGDNEQRVGRVDRLFGKVDDLLRDFGTRQVSLDINYPYLATSFDEDQVGSFIERKHEVEEKMDRCTQGSFDKEVQLVRPSWRDFLRRPVLGHGFTDPYPARFP